MQPDFEQKYHQVEQHYWWFRARRDMIARLMKKVPKGSNVLDIGCGSGLLVSLFGDRYQMHGVDNSAAALALAKGRGIPNIRKADAAATSYHDHAFDCIIASDILEHIEDDRKALAEWRRILRPGGRLIVFVPAFQALWGRHDKANRHFRRYSRPQLAGALRTAGFHVKRASYWNAAMFVPVLLFRQRHGKGDDFHGLSPWANTMLYSWLRLENSIIESLSAPVGTSVFAVCTSRP